MCRRVVSNDARYAPVTMRTRLLKVKRCLIGRRQDLLGGSVTIYYISLWVNSRASPSIFSKRLRNRFPSNRIQNQFSLTGCCKHQITNWSYMVDTLVLKAQSESRSCMHLVAWDFIFLCTSCTFWYAMVSVTLQSVESLLVVAPIM